MSSKKSSAVIGISFPEFVIRAFAAVLGNVPPEAIEWKIDRIKKKNGR